MNAMDRESINKLEDIFRKHLNHTKPEKGENLESVTLFKEIEEILCRAVCEWTEVPLAESEISKRTEQLSNMIDGSGGTGPRYHKGSKST